tara:strand:+ start:1188 stop:1457 length:270 start_codon:yes stop_codon:yes gene_type:complete
MKNISHYDSSFSPNEAGEASDTPNCGACYDEGMIIDQDVYCDCVEGDKMMNMDASIEAEFRAEENAERSATDYSYAVDSQGDDSPPRDW